MYDTMVILLSFLVFVVVLYIISASLRNVYDFFAYLIKRIKNWRRNKLKKIIVEIIGELNDNNNR